MFRRLVPTASRGLLNTVSRRSFFYANPGEVGISGKTMLAIIGVTIAFIIGEAIALRIIVFEGYSTKHQFVEDSTDLWNSDGTELEGDEATANLQIQKDRIMPFLTK